MSDMEMKKRQIPLPKHIEELCATLEKAGFMSYAVGGCVRDFLLGKTPHDYDLATAAHPEDVLRLFPHAYATGLAHGTVTVVLREGNVEITTFRTDGAYSDKRRPDGVTFVPKVEADLKRRDFTVNAMAYSPTHGFCDPYGGRKDLKAKLLRTVGDAEKRFGEDALRILRLYRFAAQLEFSIDPKTEAAAKKLRDSLGYISKERIYGELEKLLQYAKEALLEHAMDVLAPILPQMASFIDYKKMASCSSMAGKWAHLFGENVGEALRTLRAGRTITLAAEELSAYKKGKHIVADVAALRYATPEDLFSYLDDRQIEKAWETAICAGAPRSLRELQISGEEIEKIGFSGKEIGRVFEQLFLYGIKNPGDNKEGKLREVAKWIYNEQKSQKE